MKKNSGNRRWQGRLTTVGDDDGGGRWHGRLATMAVTNTRVRGRRWEKRSKRKKMEEKEKKIINYFKYFLIKSECHITKSVSN